MCLHRYILSSNTLRILKLAGATGHKEVKPLERIQRRDKITQKMTRDGAVEVNETKQTAERISKREQETDLQKTPEQQAAQDAAQLTTPIPEAAPFPSAPFTASSSDTGTAELAS